MKIIDVVLEHIRKGSNYTISNGYICYIDNSYMLYQIDKGLFEITDIDYLEDIIYRSL